jgi:hypothetical protein
MATTTATPQWIKNRLKELPPEAQERVRAQVRIQSQLRVFEGKPVPALAHVVMEG